MNPTLRALDRVAPKGDLAAIMSSGKFGFSGSLARVVSTIAAAGAVAGDGEG